MNEQNSASRRSPVSIGAIVGLGALVAIVVGAVTYNLGVAHGLAVGGQVPVAAPGPYSPYGYGWYHPWGFGFLYPFLFFGLWFLAFRVLFWGGPWRRHRYYAGRRELPPMFDEWHRRAHERMSTDRPPANG